MQRLQSVNPELAQGRTRELFDAVQQEFGVIPNTVRVMANSTAVLDSYLAFATAMGGAKIGLGISLAEQAGQYVITKISNDSPLFHF